MNSSTSKGTSQAEATSSSEKIKPISFAIMRHQAGRQAVSQSVENSVILNFCSNFLKVFRIDLKASLGLVLPNRYYHIVI